MSKYDVIILGLGALGSSAAYYLSKNPDLKILGLEQFSSAHTKGSSHGSTRMFRKAYFEESRYIPLLNEAEKFWKDLDEETGEKLFHQVGLLIMAKKSGDKTQKILDLAKKYHLDINLLQREEVLKKFPPFSLPEDWQGLWEPQAGFLEVENCVRRFQKLAEKNGADLRFETKADLPQYKNGIFSLKIGQEKVESQKLVIAAGGWLKQLTPSLPMKLKIERAPQVWFQNLQKSLLPCFAFDLDEQFIYGFPEDKFGIKIASYIPAGQLDCPPEQKPEYEEKDLNWIKYCINNYLPGLGKSPIHYESCFYTTTKDQNFVFDTLGENFPALILGGGSGHSFKFSPSLGKLATDHILGNKINHDLDFLKIRN